MKTISFLEAVNACAAGKKVESKFRGLDYWCHQRLEGPWNSIEQEYRLAEPAPDTPPAPGHNPADVPLSAFTDGLRPLTTEEFEEVNKQSEQWRIANLDAAYWVVPKNCWKHRIFQEFKLEPVCTYATRKPPGFYLQKPEPKLASGYNPDKLTEEQVGIADGWRLLTEEECKPPRLLSDTEWWAHERWNVSVTGWWSGPQFTLRTKKPPGHFLPKPKRTVPCQGLEDYPSGTLLQQPSQPSAIYEVIGWSSSGVNIFHAFRSWDELARNWQRSLDGGATWLPCTKEVEDETSM